MFFFHCLVLYLVSIVNSQFSCYNCPLETNQFDFLVDDHSLPTDLKNCSIVPNQYQCAIRLTWIRTINVTWITFVPGYEFRREFKINDDEDDGSSVKATLIYKKDAPNRLEWTNALYYTCDSHNCNNITVLRWLLKSMTIRDNLHELDDLVQMNPFFNGDQCFFFANSSVPCETEMNRTTCRQCAFEQIENNGSPNICANCVDDEDIENFITREVKFDLNQKLSEDFTMIQCQMNDCNREQIGSLIRSKSKIDFNSIPNRCVSITISWTLVTIIFLFLF